MTYFRYIPTPKILYTETVGDSLYFWPTTARAGNHTRVDEYKAVEVRADFARLGYTFVPILEARAQIRA